MFMFYDLLIRLYAMLHTRHTSNYIRRTASHQ